MVQTVKCSVEIRVENVNVGPPMKTTGTKISRRRIAANLQSSVTHVNVVKTDVR